MREINSKPINQIDIQCRGVTGIHVETNEEEGSECGDQPGVHSEDTNSEQSPEPNERVSPVLAARAPGAEGTVRAAALRGVRAQRVDEHAK